MKYRKSSTVLSIATSASMLMALASCGDRSRLQTASSMPARPAADLMVKPGEFSPPPTTTDPATGQQSMTGKDALPWAVDTLALGGDIRSKFIRLQNYVRALFDMKPPQ